MSDNIRRILRDNAEYAKEFGEKGKLGIIPARKIAILTCMDARIEPMRLAGLRTGDAHIIRNAGGRASEDAIRSLIVSNRLVGTNEWFVIHHTGCGIENMTNEKMAALANESNSATEGDYINWLTIGDRMGSVRDDVRRLREHPLTPPDVTVTGFIYDIETGLLTEVPCD
ncbi:MAG TPA: carbonic anhydrase [Thermodesulfobacteriota bacterium]|nr:carbonic anhydrase [Thermodesulfobacteriota bacterium]